MGRSGEVVSHIGKHAQSLFQIVDVGSYHFLGKPLIIDIFTAPETEQEVVYLTSPFVESAHVKLIFDNRAMDTAAFDEFSSSVVKGVKLL